MLDRSSLVPLSTIHEVRDTCECLAAQRKARLLARRFDLAFRPLGITNGQFSLMVALGTPKPWRIGSLADLLSMDRTTLTSTLNTLQRRKLVKIIADPDDQRVRLAILTSNGAALVAKAVPIWRDEHVKLAREA